MPPCLQLSRILRPPVLLLFFMSLPAAGQDARGPISGSLFDPSTEAAAPGATIELRGVNIVLESDSLGRFHYDGSADLTSLRITHPCFFPITVDLLPELHSGDVKLLIIGLPWRHPSHLSGSDREACSRFGPRVTNVNRSVDRSAGSS